MEKYIGTCKKFQMYHCNSPQGIAFTSATIESNPEYFKQVKIAIDGSNIYVNFEKDYAGVSTQRATGGKWELKSLSRWSGGVHDYLNSLNAKPASFRGGPRVKA